MQAIRLKTEHLFDPVGVDFVAPRLYWNCSGGRKQTAVKQKLLYFIHYNISPLLL